MVISGESKRTKQHSIIRKWIEERGGKPATVAGTENGNPGVLRVIFTGLENNLQEINWKDFFEKFDQNRITFLYQEKTASGRISRFYKFIKEGI